MPDLPRRPRRDVEHPADDAEAVRLDEPLRAMEGDSPAQPDDELADEVFQLLTTLRGWAEQVKAARARRYRTSPTAPGAIQLGEIQKCITQTANLIDNYSEQLARDLRR